MDTVIIDRATLAKTGQYPGAPDQSKHGGPNGDPGRTIHVQVPDGMDPKFVSSDENFALTEDTAAKDAAKWDEVRGARDQKLAACDWTQVSDSPLDAGKKTEWATYRQELRDVPDQADPHNISWPVVPTEGS